MIFSSNPGQPDRVPIANIKEDSLSAWVPVRWQNYGFAADHLSPRIFEHATLLQSTVTKSVTSKEMAKKVQSRDARLVFRDVLAVVIGSAIRSRWCCRS